MPDILVCNTNLQLGLYIKPLSCDSLSPLHSSLSLSPFLPPTLLQKAVLLSFFVFLSEPLKIASERSKLLLAYSRRSDRGEHAVRHYPKAGNRLNCCRRVIKKKTEAPFSLLIRDGGGRGGGGGELNVQFYFQPPPTPSIFLFRSAAAGLAELHSLFFFCLIQIRPFNNF